MAYGDGNLYVLSKSRARSNASTARAAFLDIFVDDPTLIEARHLAFGPDGNLASRKSRRRRSAADGTTGANLGVFATSPTSTARTA